MIKEIHELFLRDLDKLANEIAEYRVEEDLWVILAGTSNSGGNLCMHLAGNLQHFIGAVLGETGYFRDRQAEFHTKGRARKDLLKDIAVTRAMITTILPGLSEEQLNASYPIEVFGAPMTTRYFIIHLYGHLNYHLGQVNYHRRKINS